MYSKDGGPIYLMFLLCLFNVLYCFDSFFDMLLI